jgi:hypothetical protein
MTARFARATAIIRSSTGTHRGKFARSDRKGAQRHDAPLRGLVHTEQRVCSFDASTAIEKLTESY